MLNTRFRLTTLTSLFSAVLLTGTGCGPELEPALDEASVTVNNTSVRAEPDSGSRTLFRLPEGERVEVIEKSGTWYRVRDQDAFEGWMDESNLLRDSTVESMRAMLEESSARQVQNTVTTRDTVNLRLEPGRETAIIRRLQRNLSLEVLGRATTPRPDTDQTDIWFLVRPTSGPGDEIGWVYSQLVQFDVPTELMPFTEGRVYAAVRVLTEQLDEQVGPVRWYVVGERRPGADPELAFDGIRVFTWNMDAHRHETSLRLGALRGAYPLDLTDSDPVGFSFNVQDEDGNRQRREFVMRGTLPREVSPAAP